MVSLFAVAQQHRQEVWNEDRTRVQAMLPDDLCCDLSREPASFLGAQRLACPLPFRHDLAGSASVLGSIISYGLIKTLAIA